MRSARVAPLLALSLSFLLTGCGATDDDPSHLASSAPPATGGSATAPTDTAGENPAAAYRAWLAALQGHDAEAACARQAPDYTIALRRRAILEHRAELGDPCVAFEALLWEDPQREYEPDAIEITRATEEKATLAVTFPGLDQSVEMIYHRARWRVAALSDRDETAASTRAWVKSWCSLTPDMTKDELIAAMGTPSGEYTVENGGEPQLWWASSQYDFRAYLDVDGSVLELVGDYDALSAADREQLDCPELRS